MKKIDAITLEIIGNLLLSVAEEMGVTLVKTAYSTNIKERKDCSTALFDAKGSMIAQAEYVPMHLGSMLGVVTEVLKKFPLDSLRPGDMFITNDPYAGGGTHLPDITMVSPVFIDNRLVAFVANIAHHSDIGGMVPGSVSANSDNIYQEGLRIPLGRICRGGELVQETYDYIVLNTRTPVERAGDLDAQIASNIAGAKRMAEVVGKYGPDLFAECTDALLDYAEDLMRAGIRTLPNGTYTFEDYLDDAGANSDTPIPIRAAVTIEDGTAKVDFTGTSPQVPGPLNMTYSGLLTTAFYCFKAVAGQSIFANQGIYRALEVTAPEGSIVNCRLPVPVGQRIDTAQRVVDVILGALAQVAPERVLAACNSVVTSAIFSGTNPKTDQYFVYLETIAGGSGAHSQGDGLSGVQVHMTNTSNLPVEALEREYPVLVERYQLRRDSGGAGKHRGGLGIQRDFRILNDGLSYTGLGDRHKFAPWGLAGGKAGSPGSFWASHNGEEPVRLGSKISGVTLNREDLVRVCSPGSGGYGNPFERPARTVLADVLEGKVSVESARDDYGVVVQASEQGLRIDEDATEQLRTSART
ncbi:N-methylhydantoinase B [Paenibacillus sp. UNCCL117]|uniref:hydantoinase B/oxoprolinase family protein n=1 Tax=unclassified Paenibacillus TaxID=185978 RepID=UPI000883DCF3|nr:MULTISPECIES: hydantoinase B/oxoprolinase family protein [unclassified Paenibacillus]SDD06061.1 N-methylhydantoinase B [Paenibacillus sp. cl123]SFW31769.1 N-methylhydantoinase B [Paenibacillus sp. UNCCL117]